VAEKEASWLARSSDKSKDVSYYPTSNDGHQPVAAEDARQQC